MRIEKIVFFMLVLLALGSSAAQAQTNSMPGTEGELSVAAKNAFFRNDFDALEAMASAARTGLPRLSNGTQMLTALYDAVGGVHSVWDSETRYRNDAEMANRWIRSHPKSPTPYIVAAWQMSASAWKIRGGGYFSTVWKQDAVVFHERIIAARALLLKHKEIVSVDPEWYALLIRVNTSIGIDPRENFALTNEGLERYRNYDGIYLSAATGYLPQWGGDPSMFEAWARSAVSLTESELGHTMYANMYARAAANFTTPQLFSVLKPNWELLRTGIRDSVARAISPETVYLYVGFACEARDLNEVDFLWRKLAEQSGLSDLQQPSASEYCGHAKPFFPQ